MPAKRFEWLTRIKSVEKEFSALSMAVNHFQAAFQHDPTLIPTPDLRSGFLQAHDHLEGTYVLRLFAEFESSLREFWRTERQTNPRMRDLLDAIANRRRIGIDVLQNAHDVREFRNNLIHDRTDSTETIELPTARSHLCRFLSMLPIDW